MLNQRIQFIENYRQTVKFASNIIEFENDLKKTLKHAQKQLAVKALGMIERFNWKRLMSKSFM